MACSPQKLALAAKLQAKLSQHMACLPADMHADLHCLHHTQCLETAARLDDGAALLQCLCRLQPHAAQLCAPQRAAVLGAVCTRHSRVVQEAACALLLDSIAAEGGVEAAALVPAVMSQLRLSEEQQLKAVSCCRQMLAAVAPADRCAAWAALSQVG